MRSYWFIENTSPCDTDYSDKSVQSILGRKVIPCPNLSECRKRSAKENIQCSLRHAKIIAARISRAKGKSFRNFKSFIEREKRNFLKFAPMGKYWVCRNGIWSIVRGKKRAVKCVFQFVRIVLNGGDSV